MYNEGKEKVETNLDVIKILKSSLQNTAVVQAKLMDLKLREVIMKSENLVIDVNGELSLAEHQAGLIEDEEEKNQIIR